MTDTEKELRELRVRHDQLIEEEHLATQRGNRLARQLQDLQLAMRKLQNAFALEMLLTMRWAQDEGSPGFTVEELLKKPSLDPVVQELIRRYERHVIGHCANCGAMAPLDQEFLCAWEMGCNG